MNAETVLALNRNPDYCVYGAGQSKSTKNPEAAENKFNELSLQERSKIQQETLMNVGGRSGSTGLKGKKGVPLTVVKRCLFLHPPVAIQTHHIENYLICGISFMQQNHCYQS